MTSEQQSEIEKQPTLFPQVLIHSVPITTECPQQVSVEFDKKFSRYMKAVNSGLGPPVEQTDRQPPSSSRLCYSGQAVLMIGKSLNCYICTGLPAWEIMNQGVPVAPTFIVTATAINQLDSNKQESNYHTYKWIISCLSLVAVQYQP